MQLRENIEKRGKMECGCEVFLSSIGNDKFVWLVDERHYCDGSLHVTLGFYDEREGKEHFAKLNTRGENLDNW